MSRSDTRSAFQLGIARELGLGHRERLTRSVHFSHALVERLALYHELNGHEGCVNRIAWNEEGTMLASGSDDRKVGTDATTGSSAIVFWLTNAGPRLPLLTPVRYMCLQIMLWTVPDCRKAPLRVKTMHRANIFGVQFLPQTNNSKIVSCAMDHTVQLHMLERDEVESWSSSSANRQRPSDSAAETDAASTPSATAASRSCSPTSLKYYNHTNRVKASEGARLHVQISRPDPEVNGQFYLLNHAPIIFHLHRMSR